MFQKVKGYKKNTKADYELHKNKDIERKQNASP